MKAFLMYPDRDFDLAASLPVNAEALIQDLELGALFEAMASGDEYVMAVVKNGVLCSLTDPVRIQYRQHILADCLAHAEVVRRTYAIAIEALEGEKKIWGWSSLRGTPDFLTLHRALQVMQLFVPLLRKLRAIAEGPGLQFRSEGCVRFWKMLITELNEEYLHQVEDHLQRLKFPQGVVFSAALGEGNRGIRYVLREPPPILSWWERIRRWPEQWLQKRPRSYMYEIPDRDEAGHRALAELQRQGITRTAASLEQSAQHVLGFFQMLRAELAFYIGCMNLYKRLTTRSYNICFPEAFDATQTVFAAERLFDVSLALNFSEHVVTNDIEANGKLLVMITGANRGGKSTLLRSMGQAYLMMQCGLFVPATSLNASVCETIFTHFKREEDTTMRSGKLDEELKRMSGVVDYIKPHSLLLCNESFGSTNEREGSEIARQIVRAMLDRDIKVFYVTHLFDLADGMCKARLNMALFLRAQRLPDGTRTFHIEVGDPLPTSYGQDLYKRIFN